MSTSGGFAALCREPRARAHVLSLLQARAAEQKLKGFEVVKAVHLAHEQFSVDNGLMTPTFKLKRAPLLEAFQSEIDAMYAAINAGARVAPLDAGAEGGKRGGGAAAGATAKVTARGASGGGGASAKRASRAAAAARA